MMLCVLTLAAAAVSARPVAHLPAQPVYAHHAVSTKDPQAQALFDRGLTLFYAYNGSEGVHVFEQAAHLDPTLAMAYWGQALSYGSDINVPLDETRFHKGHEAIEKAVALEPAATPAERAYVEAMRARYAGSWGDHDRAETAYRNAMANAVAAYPDDDDLASIYIESLLEHSRMRLWKPGTSLPLDNDTTTMVNVLDRILARDPGHIMANHLAIHIFELSTDRSRAISAATRLDAMQFAPEDEHLTHMTAHTWIDVGQYAKAVVASTRAIALFDAYKNTPGIDPAHNRYYGHDVSIGFGAAMMLGNYARAAALARQLDAANQARSAPEIAGTMAAVRFARWPDTATLMPKSPTDQLHLALAYVKLAHDDVAGAKAELAGWSTGPNHDPLALALLGAVAAIRGDRKAADTQFNAARESENDQFEGERLPMFPSGEIAGSAYYRIGDYAAAETAFRKTLERYPNDARALFGLSETLKKLGKSTEAREVQTDFNAAWKGSDSLPTMGTL